jgi:deoxyribodipyrimidine photo-lyase
MALMSQRPPGVIYWFRNDLRLHDAVALSLACQRAQALGGWLLPVFVRDQRGQAMTRWGFERVGPFREAWLGMALQDLHRQLQGLGSGLLVGQGHPVAVLSDWVQVLGQALVVCEDIAAPEERSDVEALRQRGIRVETVWQSSLMAPESLSFEPAQVPDLFTAFRQKLERQATPPALPVATVTALPALPSDAALSASGEFGAAVRNLPDTVRPDPRSAFAWDQAALHGGERAALTHLAQYIRRGLPHSYKATRNGLLGLDYSSKWSPWLATGALSARTAWAAVAEFELTHGASDSSYWLQFELLWRDHFRWLHHKHGTRLYRARGLGPDEPPRHDEKAFERWRMGQTGHDWIDAGMRELATTGYLSNRMRQNVASHLVHDLGCDWRAGAAWFEHCLIDYDVYSNQGNWLYLSGRGTDARSNRRFNPDVQARQYDPDGVYRRTWIAGA